MSQNFFGDDAVVAFLGDGLDLAGGGAFLGDTLGAVVLGDTLGVAVFGDVLAGGIATSFPVTTTTHFLENSTSLGDVDFKDDAFMTLPVFLFKASSEQVNRVFLVKRADPSNTCALVPNFATCFAATICVKRIKNQVSI
jgi:hypothetical protein